MEKSYNEFLDIGIPDFFMNLLSCHGLMKSMNFTLVSLCPSRILEYYFSKGFVILERNSNNLSRIANNVKQKIHSMDMHDSDYVLIFTTGIPYISNTLNKLWIPSDFHSSYMQTIYNDK